MKSDDDGPPSGDANVIDLAAIRDHLRVPTLVAALLAQKAGASVRALRPGRVEADLPGSVGVEIRVWQVNIYHDEAKAYRLQGMPVPDRVLQDAERWDREHGRR